MVSRTYGTASKALLVTLILAGQIVFASPFFTGSFLPPAKVPGQFESSPVSSPVIVGWGGSRLDESSTWDSSNPGSDVFLGEQASNQELQVRKLLDMGLNGLRVSFESACTSRQEMGAYSPTDLERSITIAEHYGFWIIVDYHGYDDLATSHDADCWLSYWRPIVQQFTSRYDKIVWEPLNEPTAIGDNVQYLSDQYQRWIDQARGLGDTHWIVAQNICSYGCGLSNFADGFPSVNDTVGRVFISLHTYMGYSENSGSWNNATAESVAQTYYQAVLDGMARTGWSVLNTEGGADELSDNLAPDEILTGSAGYTTVTFHFIQALTSLYDANSPQRINWIWWTMGSWTNTPGAGLYGSLASDGWGSLLQYQRVGQVSTLSVSFSSQPSSPSPSQTVTFAATTSGGAPPYSYGWDFGDHVTGSGQTVNHVYSRSGNYSVTVSVTDSSSHTAIAQSIVSVGSGGGNHAPVISVPAPQTVDELTSLVFTVSATDSDIPAQTVRLAASGMPSGSSFDPSDGRFSWTPTETQGPGNYTAVFSAEDGVGGSVTANVVIKVREVNSPPSILLQGPKNVALGDTLTFTIGVLDSDIPQNNIVLTASGLVSGMTFESTSRLFSFTPESSQLGQNFTVTFRAVDDGTPELSDTHDQVIGVQSGNSNAGNCVLFCASSTYMWLFGVGIILGIAASFAALSFSRRRK